MRSSTPDEDILVTLVRGLGHARIIKVVSKFEKKSILKQYDSILDVLVNEDNDIAREFYRIKIMRNGI